MASLETMVSFMTELLKTNFGLYDDSYSVKAGKLPNKGIWLVYSPKGPSSIRDDITRIDINIKNKICYIPDVRIESRERRKGYGRELFEAVEEFCRELEISRIELTCSGKGNDLFYKKLGFKPKAEDSSELYKDLNE